MATLLPWVPESGWPLPLSKPIGWPDGGKKLRKWGRNGDVWGKDATLLAMTQLLCFHVSCVQLTENERQETDGHISLFFNNLRRKPSFPNFKKTGKPSIS